jgi:uncharacterized membrane protein YfcA
MEKDIVLVVAGFIVGAMNAIAGGGMLIGFPILVGVGLSPLLANATANIVTFPGQISSAYGYRSYLRRVPLRYALLLIPTVIGAIAGAFTLRHTPAADFARIVPLLVFFGVCMFTVQPLIHLQLHSHIHERRKAIVPLLIIGCTILPISFYGGYFGAGFGFMMLAFLGFTSIHDTHMMNSMKNVAAAFVSGASTIMLFSSHLIQWRTGIPMAIGAVIGGYAGSRYAQRVSSYWLRIGIIVIGLGAAIYLGLQQY